MKEESEEPKIADEAPVFKWKLTIVVALSMAVGVLVAAIIVGGFFHYREQTAWQAELRVTRNALAEKSRLLDEANAEVLVLSRQMYALKDYSIARSSPAAKKSGKVDSDAAPAVDSAASASATRSDTSGSAAPPTVIVKKKAKPKPDGQSCELVGKSPAEQEAILRRCVTMMDKGAAR